MNEAAVSIVTTLIGTIFGASVPVLFGFLYYNHQKKKDREEELFREKREVYRSLLTVLGESHVKQTLSKDGNWEHSQLSARMNAVALTRLYAPDELYELAVDVMNSTGNLEANRIHGDFGADVADIADLAEAMKNDLNAGR